MKYVHASNNAYIIPEYQNGSNTLAHYGIKGQQWGVRRFQEENGTLTEAGKIRYRGEAALNKKKADLDSEIKRVMDDYKKLSIPQRILKQDEMNARMADLSVKKQMLNHTTADVDRDTTKKGDTKQAENQAALNIIYTLANPVNAVFLAKQLADAGTARAKVNSYMKNREKVSDLDPETGLYKKKEGSYNETQDLAAVNPGFKNFNSNTKNNCMLCTTTFDMRKRGYDVTAQLDSVGYDFYDVKRWYPKAKIVPFTRVKKDGSLITKNEYAENALKKLSSQGNGARGNLMLIFGTGAGHSVSYVINNGKVTIYDGQANKVYRDPAEVLLMSQACSFARLDNVQPDIERIIKECVC